MGTNPYKNPYSSNITIEYDAGMVDMIKSHRYLIKEFNLSKFPKYLETAVYEVADRRFDAYMFANREEYKHVFEWGAKSTVPGDKLWVTLKVGDLYTYEFLPSRKVVPAKLPHTKYFHIFREKAAVMEEAPTVLIEPQRSKYLRWRGPDGEEVRNYEGIIMQVAGGKYKNKFRTAFLLFWASGGGGTMEEFAREIRNSSEFRNIYNKNQIAGLKRRITNKQNKTANGDAQARAMAAQKIKEWEGMIIGLGGKL